MSETRLSTGATNKQYPTEDTVMSSNHVLLVDDDLIIGADAKAQLLDAGIARVTVAATIAQALMALNTVRFDFAFLDVHLGRESVFPLAEVMALYKLPFAFVIGAAGAPIPQAFKQNALVAKPYVLKSLLTTMHIGLAQARRIG